MNGVMVCNSPSIHTPSWLLSNRSPASSSLSPAMPRTPSPCVRSPWHGPGLSYHPVREREREEVGRVRVRVRREERGRSGWREEVVALFKMKFTRNWSIQSGTSLRSHYRTTITNTKHAHNVNTTPHHTSPGTHHTTPLPPLHTTTATATDHAPPTQILPQPPPPPPKLTPKNHQPPHPSPIHQLGFGWVRCA